MANYTTQASVVLSLNGQQAKNMMSQLETSASRLEKKIAAAAAAGDKATMKKLQKELSATNRTLDQLKGTAFSVENVLNRLDSASPKELRRALSQLNRELNNMERGSEAWNAQAQKIRAVKSEIQAVNEQMRATESGAERVQGWFDKWQMKIAGAAAAAGGLLYAGREAVEAYAAMDQEMANVRKYTGMSEQDVATLNEAFKQMDTRTPREQLNQLAQEAGRLGKSSVEDVLGFVKAADKINVALDDLGEGATLTLSKLTGIFGDEKRLGTERALLSVGSVINELSQNCSASAPYIAEFTSRMGGVGAQAGMTVQQVMAFAAVLDSNQMQLEMSATAMSQLMMRMYQDPAKYAKVAGIEVSKFTSLIKTDMNAAMLEFLTHLNQVGDMSSLSLMFKDMGEKGQGVVTTLSTLAAHIDEVKQQQTAANEAFEQATSINQEFDVQNSTLQARLEKSKEEFRELTIQLGEKLAPAMEFVIRSGSALVSALTTLISFVAAHKGSILTLTMAIAGYTLAVNAATIKTKLFAAWQTICSTGAKAWRATTLLLQSGFFLLTGNITKATTAFKAFSAALKANPIGLVVAAITAAGAALIGYINKLRDAREQQRKAQEEAARQAREAINYSKEATEAGAKQLTMLDTLYKAAVNDANGWDLRRAAAKKLIDLYPQEFKNLSEEEIMLGRAKKAYDNLRESIIKTAMAKGAKETLEKLAKEKYEAELWNRMNRSDVGMAVAENKQKKAAIDEADKQDNNSLKKNPGLLYGAGGAGSFSASHSSINSNYIEANEDYKKTVAKNSAAISQYNRNKAIIETNTKAISEVSKDIVNLGGKLTEVGSDDTSIPTGTGYTHVPTEKELKKQRAEEAKRKRAEAAAARRAAIKARKDFKDELNNAKGDWEEGESLNNSERYAGLIPYTDFLQKKMELELKYYDDRLKIYENHNLQEDEDYKELLKKKGEAEMKWAETMTKEKLEVLRLQQAQEENELQMMALDRNSTLYDNEEALQLGLFEIKMKYLKKEQALYDKLSKEYAQYQVQIDKAEADELLRLRKKMVETYNKWLKKYEYQRAKERMDQEQEMLRKMLVAAQISVKQYLEACVALRESYLKETTPESAKSYSPEEQEAELRRDMQRDLEVIEYQEKAGIRTHEDAEKAKERITAYYAKAIRKIYTDLARAVGSDTTNQLLDIYEAWKDFFDKSADDGRNWAEKIAAVTSSTFALMGAGMQQASQFIQAQMDLDVAKAEARYDREIELAEGNTYREKKLQKEKEDYIAKVKNDASRKQYAMQVTQAVADTAVNVLKAYGSALHLPFPLSIVMGTLAAGLAAAQGAMQVAILKKQQQASAAKGYSEGGFTAPGRRDEVAGVVHAGEWVASQKLVNNPRTRPLLEALDYAQKHNTIGSISPADVSRTITAPVMLVAKDSVPGAASTQQPPQVVVSQSSDPELRQTLSRLNDRLNAPFVTVNTVAGDQGIKKAQEDYERLIKNKSPKSKKK